MSGDVFNIRDESNIERLVGTINDPLATTGDVLTVQADKSIKAVPGGGGSVPHTAGLYAISGVAAAGNLAFLVWAFSSGDAVLDLTDTANPVPVVTGTYALSATATFSGVLPLATDVGGLGLGAPVPSVGAGELVSVANLGAQLSPALTVYALDTDVLNAFGFGAGSSVDLTYSGTVYVQRIG